MKQRTLATLTVAALALAACDLGDPPRVEEDERSDTTTDEATE